jgi:hypothetical protein
MYTEKELRIAYENGCKYHNFNDLKSHFKSLNQGQTLPIDFFSETLTLDNLTVHPIDKDGDFEIELDYDSYRYIDSEQARVLIKHLQDNLNAR